MEHCSDNDLDVFDRWFRAPSAELLASDATLARRKNAYLLEWDGELRLEVSNRTIELHRWAVVENRRAVLLTCREVFFCNPDLQRIRIIRLKRDDDARYRQEAVGEVTRGTLGLHVRFDSIEARQRRQEQSLQIALRRITSAIEFAAQRQLLGGDAAEQMLNRMRREMAGITPSTGEAHDLFFPDTPPRSRDPL